MHILMIGAHPDDCDLCTGGIATLLAQRGDKVKFISVTNGDRGHMDMSTPREKLAERRLAEARKAVSVFGGEYETLGVPDGDVYVTRELTGQVIRAIRSWGEKSHGPDLVIINRPNDYHRDHRYTSQLVLDAVYLLTVPHMCPDTPHLTRMPVVAYWFDRFHEGGAFRPDVVVPIDAVIEEKTSVVAAHESQMFEWLPFNRGELEGVPKDVAARRDYVRQSVVRRAEGVAESCRGLAAERVPAGCRYAEAFQVSEYGRRPSDKELKQLFGVG